MSERSRFTADERAVRAMGNTNARRGVPAWVLVGAIICAVIGSLLVYGVFFADNNDGELPLGLDAVKITRTCDFVTIEGKTYEWCYDGTMGIFQRLEENPLAEPQQNSQ